MPIGLPRGPGSRKTLPPVQQKKGIGVPRARKLPQKTEPKRGPILLHRTLILPG